MRKIDKPYGPITRFYAKIKLHRFSCFNKEHIIKTLCCNKSYHAKCLNKWKGTCPNCRGLWKGVLTPKSMEISRHTESVGGDYDLGRLELGMRLLRRVEVQVDTLHWHVIYDNPDPDVGVQEYITQNPIITYFDNGYKHKPIPKREKIRNYKRKYKGTWGRTRKLGIYAKN